ncbi:MAG: hypothetical protein KF805_13970 [Phycisphaeraceae bacterium]|nr:hypothetical protein [Phycisphaeraceae bacterium]
MSQDAMEARKKALIAEVYAAFEGVSREGGVSWSQAYVVDNYGDENSYAAAGQEDVDNQWEELVSDESWLADGIGGGFAFLDPIGFRYYLPAAMIRELNEHASSGIERYLNLPPRGAKGRDSHLKQRALLNERQGRCTAAFVRFAIDREKNSDNPEGELLRILEFAWENYWCEFADDSE